MRRPIEWKWRPELREVEEKGPNPGMQETKQAERFRESEKQEAQEERRGEGEEEERGEGERERGEERRRRELSGGISPDGRYCVCRRVMIANGFAKMLRERGPHGGR